MEVGDLSSANHQLSVEPAEEEFEEPRDRDGRARVLAGSGSQRRKPSLGIIWCEAGVNSISYIGS